ncbi:MAG: D-glycero-beta-D-manno-heptose-7-phosphate kinase [Thermovirgaceae bacterium]
MSPFSSILQILEEGLQKARILVVGDVILDRTYSGDVERISPEAPIPVVHVKDCVHGLGGAGNVANNLRGLGCRTDLFGIAGADPEAEILRGMLREKGIAHEGLLVAERATTTKTRIVSARQQMLRVDFEDTGPPGTEEQREISRQLEKAVRQAADAVIISDYGKGVCMPGLCRHVIDLCNATKTPVVVDPKGADWGRYAGAFLVTPNLKELGEAVARDVPNENAAVEEAAKELRDRWNLDSVLVTRSDRGMTLVSGEPAVHEPALAREVFDVSGAGDTVVGIVTAFLAAGASLADSVRAANKAAGFVVGKAGTYAINAAELKKELEGDSRVPSEKILTLDEAVQSVGRWKAGGRRVVFTNGCFDILHAGHVRCLEEAKSLGDCLVVGINSDDSVRRLKGPKRPVMSQEDRARILAALHCVDVVVVFEENDPLKLVQALRPSVLVKGGDYKPEEVVGKDVVEADGGRVVIVPLVGGKSTSAILRSLFEEDESL